MILIITIVIFKWGNLQKLNIVKISLGNRERADILKLQITL